MKRHLYYRFLKFQPSDYKAYKSYLEDLALQGYELVNIGPSIIGHFKKVEPSNIKYWVEVVKDELLEEYIDVCEDSGWE